MKRAGYCLVVFMMIVTGFATLTPAADMTQLQPLLDQMPAQTAQQEQQVFTAMLAQGQDGVEAICGQLVPPGTGDDTKARYALHGLAVFANRPNAEPLRQMVSGGVIKALARDVNPEAKAFMMSQLQIVGREEAVAALAGYLADEQLCEPAVWALLEIKTATATRAIAQALPAVPSKNQITLIRALGDLRAQSAAAAIRPFASDANPELRLVAVWALANLGDEAAGELIAKALPVTSGYGRGQLTASYLLLAERLAQQNNKSRAVAICRELLADTKTTNNVSSAALSLLVDVAGAGSLNDLIQAAGSESFYLQSHAVVLAGAIPGQAATQRWVGVLDQTPAPVRAKIVTMLGLRGDSSALSSVQAKLKDDDQAVRLAAITATAQLGGPAAGDSLLAFLNDQADAAELTAAANALMQLKNQAVSRKTVGALDQLKPPARVAVINALGFWPAPGAVDTLLARTGDGESSVRLAAWRALALLAQTADFPRLVDAMLAVTAAGEQTAARQAVLAVASRTDDSGQLTPALLAKLPAAGDKQVTLLIETLGQMGGGKALAALAEQAGGAKPAIRDAAVRALAKWSDPAAIPHLMAIIKKSDNLPSQVLACRGIADLIAAADWPAARKVQNYAELMALAPRPDEKKVILARLTEVKSIEALKLVEPCLDDAALGTEAAQTAAAIATPADANGAGLGGTDTIRILTKALEKTADAKLKESIQAHLARIGLQARGNVALNRPVTTSVAQQGDYKPQFVVDGKIDREQAWWGAAWPSWLQVDLGQPVRIDTAQIVFYWDGSRYYPYTLDVSVDGQNWKTVADHSQSTTPATPAGDILRFDPVEARFVRVNIIKNSANEAVHLVELQVFSEGDGPADPAIDDAAGLREAPSGFTALFNGKDLTGWKGLLFSPNDNPIKRAALTPEQMAAETAKANEDMVKHWTAKDGILYFDGSGHSLATIKTYRDFEMWVDWKIQPKGDSGIYLRGSPQVQIWDPENTGIGSGGLYNNQKNLSKPLVTADRPAGQWNTFFIRMVDDKVTVDLNGQRVVDQIVMENYWDRARPIFEEEQIELQCHGNPVEFRNIFLRELPRKGQWQTLFNGVNLDGWVGDTAGYKVEEGAIVCRPGGNLYTVDEYSDFHFKFEFKLTPGANNGLGIRAPLSGDAAYAGMELQILDNTADKYKSLQPYQYHGSIYGVVAAKREFQKPVGEWNTQEVIAQGNRIKVILNGTTIVDADITEAIEKGTNDGHEHPGLKNKTGHIGFLGHGDVVFFRNLRVMSL